MERRVGVAENRMTIPIAKPVFGPKELMAVQKPLETGGFGLMKKNQEYSEGFQILAIGTNKQGPAYMVFKETDAGGWVFNASSITFTSALFHDPAIDKMVLNLLRGKHGSDGITDYSPLKGTE